MTLNIQPTNRFVGMFDIIGFKALRAKKGTSALHQQFLNGILPAIQHSAAGKAKKELVDGTPMYVPDFVGSTIGYRAVSDSVLFFSPDDSFDSFVRIIHSAFMLLQFGFSGGKAPYRGAIGWGDFIDDPQGILIGSAIEDAYAGESCQAWAGAMLTASCREFVETRNYPHSYKAGLLEASAKADDPAIKKKFAENSKRLVLYPVPVQHNPKDAPATYGKLKTYALDWTIRMYEKAAEASFEPSPSGHAQKIAANTENFELWARANNR